ncbi:MAG: AAA family ATPase [Sandaracinaceae bacterium]|nr:AAA family ATPase [Sandaracinaceae bacterium]
MNVPDPLHRRFQLIARELEHHFLGKTEAIRLMLIAAVAGEHMLLIGPPGTAKSALIRLFSRLIQARYFEYLFTRFTEPNEIFGPLDINAFRQGEYRRRIEGMLPEADIAFLDEIFKANSAILNSLLSILNERIFTIGAQSIRVPLISCFAASNEVPNDDDLLAIFDRFLIRHRSENLESYHFHELLVRGMNHEITYLIKNDQIHQPVVSVDAFRQAHKQVAQIMRQIPEYFLSQYKNLIFQIRAEGVSISDRRAVKLVKLFAASAYLDGRAQPDPSDFFILEHIWNSPEQIEIIRSIVRPVVDAWYREHPEARRVGALEVGLDALLDELGRIREMLLSDQPLSEIQLFSQLKALNEIKSALLAIDNKQARDAVARIDQLLAHLFQSGKSIL